MTTVSYDNPVFEDESRRSEYVFVLDDKQVVVFSTRDDGVRGSSVVLGLTRNHRSQNRVEVDVGVYLTPSEIDHLIAALTQAKQFIVGE